MYLRWRFGVDVSSGQGLGISQKNVHCISFLALACVSSPPCVRVFPLHLLLGPMSAHLVGGPRVVLSPRSEYSTLLRLWHRSAGIALTLYPHLRLVASGHSVCIPGCPLCLRVHTIGPYLHLDDNRPPGSPTPLQTGRPHTLGRRFGTHAFAFIVQARPFPAFGRPVHLWDSSL